MHSKTKEDYRRKNYNTFLRSVVILLSFYLHLSKIGSDALNRVSYFILYEDFDFHVMRGSSGSFPNFTLSPVNMPN